MNIIKDILQSVEREVFDAIASKITKKDEEYRNGDVKIISLELISEDQQRKHRIEDQVKFIDIYESIMSPSIFAEFHVQDSIGLMEDFPILGEEYISIKFQTSNKQPITYLFRVNKVEQITSNSTNKTKSYVLRCVSPEILRNSVTLLNASYKDNLSKIIQQIIENDLGTFKKLSFEETKGIEQIIIPNMNPFVAIDYLRQKSISKKYLSSSYAFFENSKGYNFITVEKLLEDISKNVEYSDRIFFYDSSGNMDLDNVNYRNILAMQQVSFVDSVSKLQNGGLKNEIHSFDMLTGNFKKIEYNNNETQDRFKFGDKNPVSMNTSGFDRKHGKTSSVSNMIPFSSENPANLLPEKTSVLSAFTQKIIQNIIQIYVYGDSEMTVGQGLTLELPKIEGVTRDKQKDEIQSGNYLISKLRHMILNSDRPQHSMSMELIRGSLSE